MARLSKMVRAASDRLRVELEERGARIDNRELRIVERREQRLFLDAIR